MVASLTLKLEPIAAAHTENDETSMVIEKDGQRAWLFMPDAATTGLRPLLIVLHGAGKEQMWSLSEGTMSVHAWADRARTHGINVLYPAARGSTWDFISSGRRSRKDVDFLAHAINRTRRMACVDDGRIGLLGISDGGSMALSLATHNPTVFQAAMSISGGFCASPPRAPTAASAPRLFLKHGAADPMFPLARVGLPLRDSLLELGYKVVHRVGEGEGGMFGPAGHVPDGWHTEFVPAWLGMPTA